MLRVWWNSLSSNTFTYFNSWNTIEGSASQWRYSSCLEFPIAVFIHVFHSQNSCHSSNRKMVFQASHSHEFIKQKPLIFIWLYRIKLTRSGWWKTLSIRPSTINSWFPCRPLWFICLIAALPVCSHPLSTFQRPHSPTKVLSWKFLVATASSRNVKLRASLHLELVLPAATSL